MDSTKQESRDDLAFLTRPERVQQISKKFNESYDALLKGDFTKRGEDGELIRTPRPELPSKYLVRPKKPAFRSSNTDAFADDSFAAFTRGTSKDNIEKKEGDRRRDTASTFSGWKALGLDTDGNDGTKRLSGQTTTYEEEPSEDTVREQQEIQSGRLPSVTDLEDKHFHAAQHIEAQQKLMEERADQQKIEELRRPNGIYPGHIGLREKDIASIIAHNREKERLRREAEHGEDDDDDEDGGQEHEKVVVGHYSARQLHQMQMRAEQGLALDASTYQPHRLVAPAMRPWKCLRLCVHSTSPKRLPIPSQSQSQSQSQRQRRKVSVSGSISVPVSISVSVSFHQCHRSHASSSKHRRV